MLIVMRGGGYSGNAGQGCNEGNWARAAIGERGGAIDVMQ